MKKVDPATVQRRSSAVADAFTPSFTSISSERAVNVSWLWCEQVAEPAVSAAVGAQRAPQRTRHLSLASRGAETKANRTTRRATDAGTVPPWSDPSWHAMM